MKNDGWLVGWLSIRYGYLDDLKQWPLPPLPLDCAVWPPPPPPLPLPLSEPSLIPLSYWHWIATFANIHTLAPSRSLTHSLPHTTARHVDSLFFGGKRFFFSFFLFHAIFFSFFYQIHLSGKLFFPITRMLLPFALGSIRVSVCVWVYWRWQRSIWNERWKPAALKLPRLVHSDTCVVGRKMVYRWSAEASTVLVFGGGTSTTAAEIGGEQCID